MLDVLIALETNLASGIAIRYACQLEKSVRFNMQAIHIPDMKDQGHSHGGGWVHQTWENAVVQQAKKDIAKLVKEDLFYCYLTRNPKIIPGEKESVILDEIKKKQYDFFIEGLLHAFDPNQFFQKLDSSLYRSLPCPVLVVKNLMDPEQGIQIAGTPETILSLLHWFFKLFNDLPADPDILVCHFETSGEEAVLLKNDSPLIEDIENIFLKQGRTAGTIKEVKGSVQALALLVRDHALVISDRVQSRSHMAQLLSMSPCPILLCPELTTDKTL